jgi:hypothetical protein
MAQQSPRLRLIRAGSPRKDRRVMAELTGIAGFATPVFAKRFSRRRNLGVQLIATVALVICLIIAVTAVSIGMARAAGGRYSTLMPAALTIGHHLSTSAC